MLVQPYICPVWLIHALIRSSSICLLITFYQSVITMRFDKCSRRTMYTNLRNLPPVISKPWLRCKGKSITRRLFFDYRKLTLIHDIDLYYRFLQSETANRALTDNPENWVREDSKLWRDQGCHPTIASANASLSGTTANATAPPTTAAPELKKAENTWMSWQYSKRVTEKYPILPNDREYIYWLDYPHQASIRWR